MSKLGLLGLAVALGAGATSQESNFESADYGVRLAIPAGWTIDATRQARVILKLTQAEGSSLLVYEVAFTDPVTPVQYKEQLRHFLQRGLKEPRMLDDRGLKAGGRGGFCLEIASRGTDEREVVALKGVVGLSPRRMIAVDAEFPRARLGAVRPAYDALLASLQFFPRRLPFGADDGLKRFEETVKKLSTAASPPAGPDELGIFVGDKRVGVHTFRMAPAVRLPAKGVEVEALTLIDLGDEGKAETTVRGFLSDDLAVQEAEVTEVKTSKEKRVQNFWARVTLSGGELRMERRINGERWDVKFPAPSCGVLADLQGALQARLLDTPQALWTVAMVAAFDDEPSYLKIERGGAQKFSIEGAEIDTRVTRIQRPDGTVITYLHDAKRSLVSVTQSNQAVVMRRLKK